MTDYSDIIDLERPISKKHKAMPMEKRAAQFASFAALRGHSAAIEETARLTDRKMELDENRKEELDAKLQLLWETVGTGVPTTITYFLPDEKKDGGSYVDVTGAVKKIDTVFRQIVMETGELIPIDDIFEII